MMKHYILFLLMLLVSFGCTGKKELPGQGDAEELATETESVTDSVSLRLVGQFKVRVRKYILNDENRVEVVTWEKRDGVWNETHVFEREANPVTSLDVSFTDFNNDGLKDMTFISGVATSPSNQIRTLFLFDGTTGKFRMIENSSEFPNLRYNDELNCVDAWFLYGGSITVFLKIEGDSLKEFAGVELVDDTRTVYEIDADGNKTILQKEKVKDLDVNTRYKTYKPLKARF